jgi:ribosomal protein L14E/L6E/L27E
MEMRTGLVVRSRAGRDKGGLFAVMAYDERFVWIADGAKHKTDRPKKKNLRHVAVTRHIIEKSDLTDKRLRQLLAEYSTD